MSTKEAMGLGGSRTKKWETGATACALPKGQWAGFNISRGTKFDEERFATGGHEAEGDISTSYQCGQQDNGQHRWSLRMTGADSHSCEDHDARANSFVPAWRRRGCNQSSKASFLAHTGTRSGSLILNRQRRTRPNPVETRLMDRICCARTSLSTISHDSVHAPHPAASVDAQPWRRADRRLNLAASIF